MTVHIAIPLFPGVTALDAVGPYEVLQRVPEIDVVFIGHKLGLVRADNEMLGMQIDATFEDLPTPDVIVFPGGDTAPLMGDARVLEWLRTAHRSSTWTTSVCTGSLVLAAAGLLRGRTATTHWIARGLLQEFGATAIEQRVVEHPEDRLITAAGVSSGIDMALRLVELLVDRTAAQAAQLWIEYDPQPPFDAGALERADTETLDRVFEYIQHRA